ncbi:hypothetical protein AYO38_05810 [bacterium SCGC AG-212-C10]|nr:hypothetical protein AYO38_05810 [bacterium SCGC AG-212-C10]
MRYMLLIYNDQKASPAMGTPEREKMHADYGAFTQQLIASGAMRAGDGLLPASSATTVRVKGGKTLTSDGPFAETKEQLGGYYIVEVENLQQATNIAAMVPDALNGGSVEIRPILEM